MTSSAGSAPLSTREVLWDTLKTVIYAVALAMVLRFAVAQPFRIPSGSMQPTLLVGDYVVVTKWSYGYSRFSVTPLQDLFPGGGRLFAHQPERGDIVVFRPEPQADKDYIKRVVGLPGDRIQMRAGVLFINDQPVQKEPLGLRTFTEGSGETIEIETFRETLPNGVSYTTFDRAPGDFGALDTTPVFEVPEGRYFMMGDDRDNSADSRTSEVGFVPFDHLVGKAQFVFVSFDHSTKIWAPWTLATGLRTDRMLKGLN